MAVRWPVRISVQVLVIYFILPTIVICQREVTLLDTTTSSRLEWSTHKNGDPDSQNLGWREGSFSENGTPIRVYSSCSVVSQGVDNWLRTPYIPRGDANSLHIKLRFSMRKCVKHNNLNNIQACKETFKLYYYEADSDIANEMMPTWDGMTYQLIDIIAAKELYTDASEIKLNTVKKEVPLARGLGGVYFAFQDTGACVALISIQVYYVLCENTTINYAFFMETPTGDGPRALEERSGVCVPNSVKKTPPTYLCKSDGTWYYPKGHCECNPGFQGQGGKRCVECQPNFYKSEYGNSSCQKCPAHSYTTVPQSVECSCLNGYYRRPDDFKNMSCTQPPSEPQNLQVIQKTYNSITLMWSKPMYDGGRSHDLTYEVECDVCGSGTVLIPGWRNFNQTSVKLTKLDPTTTYTIKIYSQNGVSEISGKERQYQQIAVITESSVATIINVRVVARGRNYFTITWDVPLDMQGLITIFEVKWSRVKEEKVYLNHTKIHNYTFKNLHLDTEYIFQVRGRTAKGWGDYSSPQRVITGDDEYVEIEAPLPSIGIIVGAVVAVVLCMAIATIMIIILLKRNRNHCSEPQKGVGECDTLHYSHVVQCPPLEPHLNGGLTMPLFQSPGSTKTYVDPHTYEDPNQAVREFTREIDSSHITIESVIGGGHPIMIVTEYMANGSLDTFLRNNDGRFTVIQLVGMMRGIASGMKYLSEMGYVHRDLAARNILVNDNLVCKVADFGLSREVDIDTTDGAYTTKGGKIPVRWTAPEAIAYRKFTSASDVWSFGVTKWEVISYGERPYWNWSNQDVIRAVEKGYRLPPPMDCPEAIHQLMLDCWQKERGNRPKFAQIVKTLDKLIRAPELLRKKAKPRPDQLMDTIIQQPQEVSHFSSVEGWLISIKMEKYIDSFLQNGYRTMEAVTTITVRDLEQLGVTLIGHQKKIMNSIQTLRAQMYGPHFQMSEGFLV
ncbi:hypothetical protein KUTeg_001338 [Tegillarca granosa]|uniref:receptor protein-tyrosine kinase n=1 Tax=Tegillarca granosa TaxID=220873 RepID=A0ABQ9FUE5_TEGGR|nr:hypothetical protein KUTeg_001338 [Tegillarca granosa]